MNLFILRHGIAVEPGTEGFLNDADRPLTPKGEKKLGRIVEAMKKLELSFDLILSSPYVRARQTAEIVAAGYGSKNLAFSETLTPEGHLPELVQVLNKRPEMLENVLLVGHEPHLSSLISMLVSGSPVFSVLMKKGGLCKLSLDSLQAGRCATLEWLLTPKQMELMS